MTEDPLGYALWKKVEACSLPALIALLICEGVIGLARALRVGDPSGAAVAVICLAGICPLAAMFRLELHSFAEYYFDGNELLERVLGRTAAINMVAPFEVAYHLGPVTSERQPRKRTWISLRQGRAHIVLQPAALKPGNSENKKLLECLVFKQGRDDSGA